MRETTKVNGREQVWLGGAPGHVSFATVRRDLACYRRLRCRCGASGPRLTPQHTKEGTYRILAECRNCGAKEVC